MPATTGMKGAGYYDQHSTAQLSSIQAFQDWVDAPSRTCRCRPPRAGHRPGPGLLGGRNAIRLMGAIVEGLRRRHRAAPSDDLQRPGQQQLQPVVRQPGGGPHPGLFSARVYSGAVGGSFYGPLLPPGTVHLATSFNAIHWLDHLPGVPLPDFVAYRRPHPPRQGLAVSPEATAAFTRQAEQDLVRFLECRARELVPGGKLLLASPGDTNQASVCDGLFDVLNDACLDLVAAGRLEREQYERLTIPVYCRTVAELLAPLEREDSPVRGAFAVDRAQGAGGSDALYRRVPAQRRCRRLTPGPTPASCVPSPSR